MRTVTRRRLSSPWPAAPRISTPSHQHLITVAITQGDGACPIKHLVGRPARAAEAELRRGVARLGSATWSLCTAVHLLCIPDVFVLKRKRFGASNAEATARPISVRAASIGLRLGCPIAASPPPTMPGPPAACLRHA